MLHIGSNNALRQPRLLSGSSSPEVWTAFVSYKLLHITCWQCPLRGILSVASDRVSHFVFHDWLPCCRDNALLAIAHSLFVPHLFHCDTGLVCWHTCRVDWLALTFYWWLCLVSHCWLSHCSIFHLRLRCCTLWDVRAVNSVVQTLLDLYQHHFSKS